MLKNLWFAAVVAALPTQAWAQHSPYVGHMNREIKALAPDRIDGLRRGDGLGYALAAELNGYPGPKHVLELATDLALTPDQRDTIQEIYGRMNATARNLGTRLIEVERSLDSLFAAGNVTPERLQTQLQTAGSLDTRLRYTHLAAHLEVTALLTEQQIAHYQMVRGYADHTGHR